jgi:hypothetical protein
VIFFRYRENYIPSCAVDQPWTSLSFVHTEGTNIVQQCADGTFLLLPFCVAVHIAYWHILINVIHICEGEYIQRYEDIHTNFSTSKFQNNCIYYRIILTVIITKAPLCNTKLNDVQLVGSKIFVLYSAAFNMFNLKNMKHGLCLLKRYYRTCIMIFKVQWNLNCLYRLSNNKQI